MGQLGCTRWVRVEESGCVDDEGRPILESVDLMETLWWDGFLFKKIFWAVLR